MNKSDSKQKQQHKKIIEVEQKKLAISERNNAYKHTEWPKENYNKQMSNNLDKLMDAQSKIMHTVIDLESDINRDEPTLSLEIMQSSTLSQQELNIQRASDVITKTRGPSNNNLSPSYRQRVVQSKQKSLENLNSPAWQVNKRPTKRRKQINIGTADTVETKDNFTGKDEDKKVWLFISRVKDHVTEENIKSYIKNKAKIDKEEEVVVRHITTKYDTIRKDCKCFQVGVKFEKKDMVYEQNFWPNKVAFRRFDFEAKKHMEEGRDF